MAHKLMIAFALLSFTIACEKPANKEKAPDPPDEAKPTKEPSKPPAEKVKLTLALQPNTDLSAAKQLGDFVKKETGFEVEVAVPESYPAVIEAMRKDNAQVAYMQVWPYLKAHMAADADLLLVEERDGNAFYQSSFFVLNGSAIKSVADLKGKSIAFASPTSASGYLFPMAELVAQKIVDPNADVAKFGNFRFAGDEKSALRSLLAGKVDVAAAAADANSKFLSPEEQKKLRALPRHAAVPTRGIAIRAKVDKGVRQKLKSALLKLNDAEQKSLLKSAFGADKLVERSHFEHTKDVQDAQDAVGHEYPLAPKEAK